MLRGTHAKLVSLIIIVATWALALWALLYIHDHLHSPMPSVIQWSASAWSLFWGLIQKTSGLILAPFAVAGPKIPKKVTYLSLIAFLFLLGSSAAVAEPVVGWCVLGVATLLVAVVATVVLFAAFAKDPDRGTRALNVFKAMTGMPEPEKPAAETPSESGPTSPDGAPETA